jgi:hypothetical protein
MGYQRPSSKAIRNSWLELGLRTGWLSPFRICEYAPGDFDSRHYHHRIAARNKPCSEPYVLGHGLDWFAVSLHLGRDSHWGRESIYMTPEYDRAAAEDTRHSTPSIRTLYG